MAGIQATPYTRLATTMLTPTATAALAGTDFAPLTKNVRLTAAQMRALTTGRTLANRVAFPIGGATRVEILPILDLSTGADANNGTCDCNLWLVTPTAAPDGTPGGAGIAEHLGKLSVAAGSHDGSAGATDAADTESFCDELTFTLSDESSSTIKGPGADHETADEEGTNQVYTAATPANDVGKLMLRALGRASFLVFEPFNPSANARFNALVRTSNV